MLSIGKSNQGALALQLAEHIGWALVTLDGQLGGPWVKPQCTKLLSWRWAQNAGILRWICLYHYALLQEHFSSASWRLRSAKSGNSPSLHAIKQVVEDRFWSRHGPQEDYVSWSISDFLKLSYIIYNSEKLKFIQLSINREMTTYIVIPISKRPLGWSPVAVSVS